MKHNFGLGLITYNNIDRFRECISTIPNLGGRPFVVVNDGDPYDINEYRPDMILVQHVENKKIAKTKNDAIRYLMSHDVEWIFIMENDILIKDHGVFDRYIDVAIESGLMHLNFALHGDDNWKPGRTEPNPRLTYHSGLALYRYAGGCFQLFHRSLIEQVGLFDEYYINCWEHLDLTFRATLAGLHTPFWLAADIVNAHHYLEQSPVHQESTTSTLEVNNHYWDGLYYWHYKYGSWFGNTKDWINPEFHSDRVVDMFKNKKYKELEALFKEYYHNDNGFYFNHDLQESHIIDNTWARRIDGKVIFFSR